VALQQGNSEKAQVLYEESLSLFQMLDERNQLAYISRRLGLVACYRRNWPAAVMRLHESIKLNQEVGSQGGIAACLATLAAVSVALGQTAHAAQLLGAVEALTVSNHVQLMALDQDQFDRTVNTVHAKLSEAVCARAWAEGQAMTLEQAIEKAMGINYQLQPPQPAVLIEPLNERELEMLRLIADGLSNHEIAERLVIALSTVKWHVGNLFSKLGVNSRTQAIARAKEIGLL
jgi:non-specific serine/threonine protein kinase